MDIINDGGNGKEQDEKPQASQKLTHEQALRQFSGELNEILSKGYPMTAVLQILESAVFEFRMGLYMAQMEMMERERQNQRRIEIPNMKIPTTKQK